MSSLQELPLTKGSEHTRLNNAGHGEQSDVTKTWNRIRGKLYRPGVDALVLGILTFLTLVGVCSNLLVITLKRG